MGKDGAWLWIPLTEQWCWPPDVDLSENQLGAVGAQAVCAALVMNPAIQRVQLAGNGLEEQAAQYLAELLLANTGLKSLDLSYNQLNDQAGNIWPVARATIMVLMYIFLWQGRAEVGRPTQSICVLVADPCPHPWNSIDSTGISLPTTMCAGCWTPTWNLATN